MSAENTIMTKISNISSYYPTAETITTSICGQPITINSSVFSAIRNPWEEKIKEYCDATDEHLDQLEGDIDFLDKKRKEANDERTFLFDKASKFECELALLKDENAKLRTDLNDLYSEIYMLRQKFDNQ